MSGDYLHRLVAVPSAHAIRLKVAPIQCEHPSSAERLCGRGERRVRKVHRMVRVQLHELEGSREGGTVEQPHREAIDDRRTQPLVALATMHPLPHKLRFVLVALAGWMNQQQRDLID
jgi:hypothetical protein